MFKQEVQTLLNYLWEATNQPQFVALWSPGRLQWITSEKRRESNHLYIFYIMFSHQWTLRWEFSAGFTHQLLFPSSVVERWCWSVSMFESDLVTLPAVRKLQLKVKKSLWTLRVSSTTTGRSTAASTTTGTESTWTSLRWELHTEK